MVNFNGQNVNLVLSCMNIVRPYLNDVISFAGPRLKVWVKSKLEERKQDIEMVLQERLPLTPLERSRFSEELVDIKKYIETFST